MLLLLIIILLTIFLLIYCINKSNEQQQYKDVKTFNDISPFPISLYLEKDFPLNISYRPSAKKNRSLQMARILPLVVKHYNERLDWKVFVLNDERARQLIIREEVPNGTCKKFDGPGGILAHSFYPRIGQICLDTDEIFSDLELYQILIHEIGHSLGSMHRIPMFCKDYGETIMSPVYNKSIMGLTECDVQFFKKYYPFMHQ
ncbi:mp-nase-like protein [Glossina pallidipes salivary gland hypertrophy virus]|uniref:Mp-nase-like protein n=1 Tax=Glossina hytrovirus (isolate Glossina pallidipes/Ethiopia/Seibersdorf/-) TaxID=379529 RepID=A0A0Y0M3K0_GHVS|nr:mp-nase-like protein [Glossina pallidipes salivary gland hypertrophy virus]